MRDALGAEAEGRGIGVAGLLFETATSRWCVRRDAAACRSSGGSPRRPRCLQRFAQQDGVGFAAASGGILLLAAVDEAVEEGAGGDDDGCGADGAAVAKLMPRRGVGGRSRRSSGDGLPVLDCALRIRSGHADLLR